MPTSISQNHKPVKFIFRQFLTDFDFTYLNGPAKKNQSNYSYDKTSQLTSATYNFMQDERYNFDLNGNRKQAEIQGQKQQYKTAEYNRLISDNESEYKYDLEGNRISKISNDGSTIKYYWDNRNRLTKLDTSNGSIEYIYDHQNRIVLRKQGETKTTFIHDGWQIVLQFDNNDKLTHRYLWGTKQDELMCDNDNWTLNDHLNTIRDIVKSDGTVTDHLEYNSFGKIISATKNDSQLQFAYTGKLTDTVSGLQWNINRWYDAEVGRWVSEDPIGFKGGDGNLYRYVNHNTLIAIDYIGFAPSIVTVTDYAVGFNSGNEISSSSIGSNFIQQLANIKNLYSGKDTPANFLKDLPFTLVNLPNIFNSNTQDNFTLTIKEYDCAEIWRISLKYDNNVGKYLPNNRPVDIKYRNQKYKSYKLTGQGSTGFDRNIPIKIGGIPLTVRLHLNVSINNLSITANKYRGTIFDLTATGTGTIQFAATVGKILQSGIFSFGAEANADFTTNFTISAMRPSPTNTDGHKLLVTATSLLSFGIKTQMSVGTVWDNNLQYELLFPQQSKTISVPIPF
jgi:RHS repeat-associated protein